MTLTRPLQDLGTGDVRAIALKQFSGRVLSVFDAKTVFMAHGMKQAITSGKSMQFPVIGTADAYEHTAGEDLVGTGQPPTEERTIPVDNKEIVSDGWYSKVDQFWTHFEFRMKMADAYASAVARTLDSRAARMIALGARQLVRTVDYPGGATSDFPAGTCLRANNGASHATVALAYPATTAGSVRVQTDLARAAQALQDANVPIDGTWTAIMSPYVHRVLRMDRGLSSREYQDPFTNKLLTRVVDLVEGFRIEMSTQIPNAVVADGEAAYQGRFDHTAFVCVGGPDAFGILEYGGGIAPWGPEYHSVKRAHHLGAAWHGGIKWLVPESCVEVYANTADYTDADADGMLDG